jgi:hypothetical protein
MPSNRAEQGCRGGGTVNDPMVEGEAEEGVAELWICYSLTKEETHQAE